MASLSNIDGIESQCYEQFLWKILCGLEKHPQFLKKNVYDNYDFFYSYRQFGVRVDLNAIFAENQKRGGLYSFTVSPYLAIGRRR